MSESQGIPRTRVSLAQGKLGLLVNRALECHILKTDKHVIQNRSMRQQKSWTNSKCKLLFFLIFLIRRLSSFREQRNKRRRRILNEVCYVKQNENSSRCLVTLKFNTLFHFIVPGLQLAQTEIYFTLGYTF